MHRFKLTLSYDGGAYHGWQKQPSVLTVEEVIESAMATILQSDIDVIGQGRTDAGVHALCQVAHFDVEDIDDIHGLVYALNRLLPDDICVREIERVHQDFHARFDARDRTYGYRFSDLSNPLQRHITLALPRNCDVRRMQKAASVFLGEYDFKGFSKYNKDAFTTLCTVTESRILDHGNTYEYEVTANRFLRNMVRRIMGTLLDVGLGKTSPEEISQALQTGETVFQKTAPPHPLILKEVTY
ncbi:MAG: tRNA pseudouridine(38-40) synthase TruA [Bacteroidota bacterium]